MQICRTTSPLLYYNSSHFKQQWKILSRGYVTISPYFDQPKEFWRIKDNQEKFISWLSNELKYKQLSDWYNVQKKDFSSRGGTPLLQLYDGSPVKVLQSIYDTHEWEMWKFGRIAKKELPVDETKLVNKYIKSLEQELKITKLEDWYSISQLQIDEYGGATALRKFGGLEKALQVVYPSHEWDSKKLESVRKKSHQRWLRVVLGRLFPDKKIYDEYDHPTLHYTVSKEQLQFDIFIPDYNLAIEYYGPHHYREVPFFGPRRHILERDEDKRRVCRKNNITLLEIPYWWNDSQESLVATIDRVRPDLVKNQTKGEPIPSQDPKLDISEPKKKSDIMNFLLTPLTWHETEDPTGWWMLEQYLGVRVFWDGKFVSSKRSGTLLPPHMHEGLPPVPLEGVVWMEGTVNFLRSRNPDNWKNAIMYIVDAPTLNLPYEQRLEKIKSFQYPKHVQVVSPVKCTGMQHFKEFCEKTEAKGGEGVLMKRPNSMYENGSLYNYKNYGEMYVKYIGASEKSHRLVVERDNGESLMISCSHQTLTSPPPKGSTVLIRYTDRNGSIVAPCFVSLSDLKWADAKIENKANRN